MIVLLNQLSNDNTKQAGSLASRTITPSLQPVAHALLQAREEVTELMNHFNQDKLWEKPAGVASVGFHLQHMVGVLDRLFTYAKGELLNNNQFEYLKKEGQPDETIELPTLVNAFSKQVDKAIEVLRHEDKDDLHQFRTVGRAQLPTTVIGLYIHAAEHTMRHLGQLLVTARIMADTN